MPLESKRPPNDSDSRERVYLDNAATSWPKPEPVYAAVDAYQRESGVAVGRGATRRGLELGRLVARCREQAATLLAAPSPNCIVFTAGGTDGLNLVLHGLLKEGDHVVTTVMEHNSVLRPLRELRDRLGIEVTYVRADSRGLVDPADVRTALTQRTRLVALNHASNVTGTVQPAAEIGRIAREQGALFLLDAAQSAGHARLDVRQLHVDLLACPGHKGLLGPLGTGLVYVAPGVETQLRSLRQGGTGSLSEEDRQPEVMTDKYEAGNHNAPGIVGLAAALAWIERQGADALTKRQHDLTGRLIDGLQKLDGVRVHGPPAAGPRTGVVSINFENFEPQDAAAVLDANFGIEVRAGLHCAPRAHAAIGTLAGGGTVRFSPGPFTTVEHIDRALEAAAALGAN